jgi:predicted nuclease with TOPRIM domain
MPEHIQTIEHYQRLYAASQAALTEALTELRQVRERLASFEQRVIAAEERAEALKLENLNLEERALDAEAENERLRAALKGG